MTSLLLWVRFRPFLGAMVLWFLPYGAVSLHRQWSLWVSLVTRFGSLFLWGTFDGQTPELFQQVTEFQIGWKGTLWLNAVFGMDGISLWMILRTTALFPICILCSWNSLSTNSKEFLTCLLVMESMLIACWTVLDLLSFYVLYESVLIPMFRRIGLGGSRARKIRAAYQLRLYTLFGSLLMLPCLLCIYSETGTTQLELLYQYDWTIERQLVLWWGFFFAFAVKIPMVPLHLWLPEAHVEAPTAGSVRLAGVLRKLGAYGFRRFTLPFFPEASSYYSPWVLTRSLIARIYTSLTTLRQVDFKKIIAYSSVAHMSLITLALFSFNDLALYAAVWMVLSHGIVSPAMFRCVGVIYDRTHTKLLKYLGGTASTMPRFSAFFFFFSLGHMALPLFPNFIAEFLTLCGVFQSHTWAFLLSCTGMVRSAAYTLWAYARVVHGLPKNQYTHATADLCRREFWVFVPLLLLCIWFGIWPTTVLDSRMNSVRSWNQLLLLKS